MLGRDRQGSLTMRSPCTTVYIRTFPSISIRYVLRAALPTCSNLLVQKHMYMSSTCPWTLLPYIYQVAKTPKYRAVRDSRLEGRNLRLTS